MITSLIKFTFIYFFCIIILHKSLHLHHYPANINWIFATLLALIAYLLSFLSNELSYIIPLLLLWIISGILSNRPHISFAATIISFTISFSIYACISFLISIIIIPFFRWSYDFPLFALSTGIIQFILCEKLFTTKRFQNGVPFLSSTIHVHVVTILSILFIGSTIFMSNIATASRQRIEGLLFFVTLLAILIFLIYWWQAQITKAYRRSLELRELESMRTEMAELKIKMQAVMDENERLARITHRDNTLISALKNSTVKYLSTDFANPAVAAEVRNQLIENINSLSAGRTSLIETDTKQTARSFDTGLPLLDELLNEMDAKALEQKISFSVHMGTSLDDFVPKNISESDLVHTVDDLLKNAFKATTTCEKRVVQLQFYKLGKHLVLEVADNGIPFEIKSLVHMGMEKLTTYEDGSGIGLVDIWSTKEKYGATYHLDECVNAAPFSKKISLTFDKKNRYSIRSLRKDEILQASRRADLQVYDYNE